MRRLFLLNVGFLAGCATGAPVGASAWTAFRELGPSSQPRPVPTSAPARPPVLSEDARGGVVAAARALVGHRVGEDCTGLIRAVFKSRSVDLLADGEPGDNGVTAIYRFALGRGRVFTGGHPLPGDLVFFKDTWDSNGDGRRNDGLTHVGLVESVDGDGTVSVIHRVARGVVRYRMNLDHPAERRFNDALRMPGKGGAVLTGQLFAAYATLFTKAPAAAASGPRPLFASGE